MAVRPVRAVASDDPATVVNASMLPSPSMIACSIDDSVAVELVPPITYRRLPATKLAWPPRGVTSAGVCRAPSA